MPTFNSYTQQQAGQALAVIGAAVYTPIAPLRIQAWWSREPLPFAARTQGTPRSLAVGDTWGDLFDCAWFHFTGVIPIKSKGQSRVRVRHQSNI
jgi:alpha-mannosidase